MTVIANRRVARATWWLELQAPEVAALSRPGQFVMIGYGLESAGSFQLPRPFSVGWRDRHGTVGLLLRAFGPGTRRLSTLREGDPVLLLGPLGRPFRVEKGRRTLCVAGGVGLAPFLFLAAEARRGGLETTLLYGEREGAYVFDPSLITSLTGGNVEVWTEDGGLGRRGKVTEGIDLSDDPLLLGCGPMPMLRAMARGALRDGRSLQVAVEEYMACGVGTCQGCVVLGADGRWRKACVDGPVFDARELDWS
ncbi:MAG: dihydroorotate dehydrogenase electron transfer subunit [Gemmatimonadota bacterium]